MKTLLVRKCLAVFWLLDRNLLATDCGIERTVDNRCTWIFLLCKMCMLLQLGSALPSVWPGPVCDDPHDQLSIYKLAS